MRSVPIRVRGVPPDVAALRSRAPTATLPRMDGFAQSIGSALSNLLGNAMAAVGAAIGGAVAAIGTVVPPALVPVIGIGLLVLIVLLIFKR